MNRNSIRNLTAVAFLLLAGVLAIDVWIWSHAGSVLYQQRQERAFDREVRNGEYRADAGRAHRDCQAPAGQEASSARIRASDRSGSNIGDTPTLGGVGLSQALRIRASARSLSPSARSNTAIEAAEICPCANARSRSAWPRRAAACSPANASASASQTICPGDRLLRSTALSSSRIASAYLRFIS